MLTKMKKENKEIVYQWPFSTFNLKVGKALNILLLGNQKDSLDLKLSHYKRIWIENTNSIQ